MRKALRLAGVTVLLWGVALALGNCEERSRFLRYKAWARHYAQVLGVKQQLYFVQHWHPEFCGWVQAKDIFGAEVGFDNVSKECLQVNPRELALHEMCHLRWQHIYPQGLTAEQQHVEVKFCVDRVKRQEDPLASR